MGYQRPVFEGAQERGWVRLLGINEGVDARCGNRDDPVDGRVGVGRILLPYLYGLFLDALVESGLLLLPSCPLALDGGIPLQSPTPLPIGFGEGRDPSALGSKVLIPSRRRHGFEVEGDLVGGLAEDVHELGELDVGLDNPTVDTRGLGGRDLTIARILRTRSALVFIVLDLGETVDVGVALFASFDKSAFF